MARLARLLTLEVRPSRRTAYVLVVTGAAVVPRAALDTLIARSRGHRNGHRATPAASDPMTIASAARLARVRPTTVANAIGRGELNAFTLGGGVRRWLWKSDVVAWRTTRRERPGNRHRPVTVSDAEKNSDRSETISEPAAQGQGRDSAQH